MHQHNVRERHFKCSCSSTRAFIDQHSLDQHKRIHLPRKNACPVPDCTARCASLTDVVLHILAQPHDAMSRIAFDDYIINSPLRTLVVSRRCIERARDGSYRRKVPLRLVDDARAGACWNGSLYLCDVCDAKFSTRGAVISHLRSPVHDDKIYKCKKSGDWDGCGNEYTTLGALLQHIDSGCREWDQDEIEECLEDVLKP